MNESILYLLSILVGIIAANTFAYFSNRDYFGLTGNTIIGVFGSVFFTKIISRMGYNPYSILVGEHVEYTILIVYLLTSLVGGIIGLMMFKRLVGKYGK